MFLTAFWCGVAAAVAVGAAAGGGLPAPSGDFPIESGLVRPIRILPLGDSITQGGRADRPEYTYRYPLYYMLRKAGYSVEYVGSLREGLQPGAVWAPQDGVPFDPRHEGHYGWKTAAVRDKLSEWMRGYPAPPDIVLIHLGSNDQGATDYDAAIVRPLREMIGLLRGKNPHVAVFLGHLNFNGGAALKIRPLVDALAKEMSTKESPVVTVAHYKGWHENPADAETDTFDWAHPNPSGQRKMAAAWFAAMKPTLDHLKKTLR